MNKEIILKRLSIIKLLYNQGVYQSRQSETISFFSILSFHDSMEMFVKLLAEKNNLKSEKLSFIDYWEKIPDLTLKEAARTLNLRRVNIKHKGIIPARVEVEASRTTATEFFNENSIKHFDIDFSDISLIEMVENTSVKEILFDADKGFKTGETRNFIEKVKQAFLVLIDSYKRSKGDFYGRTPLDLIAKINFRSGNSRSFTSPSSSIDRQFVEIFREINQNFQQLEKTISIVALGIDYKKYMKFEALTPVAYLTSNNEYIFRQPNDKNWTKENCEFCIDFVVECAMKLQEFDFDYNSIYKL